MVKQLVSRAGRQVETNAGAEAGWGEEYMYLLTNAD